MRRLVIVPLATAALLSVSACQPAATKEYVYPAWGFRVSFLSPPQVTEKPAQPDGTPHTVLIEAESGGHDFAVNANDAPNVGGLANFTETLVPLMLQDIAGGEATARTDATTADGLTARQFDIVQNGRPTLRVRVFLVGDHAYTLVAKSAFGLTDPAVADFLGSFHLLAGAPTTNAAAAANGAS